MNLIISHAVLSSIAMNVFQSSTNMFGNEDTIPATINIEPPLPIPCIVIWSANHITNAVPAVITKAMYKYEKAFKEIGIELSEITAQEQDAGLGNGGLGRLAACYLDGLATTGYPATGHSICYEYGIFKQQLEEGWQTELPEMHPDSVLHYGVEAIDYQDVHFFKHPEWVETFKERGVHLNAWTVNDEEGMTWFLDREFDYITTDNPERLLERTVGAE